MIKRDNPPFSFPLQLGGYSRQLFAYGHKGISCTIKGCIIINRRWEEGKKRKKAENEIKLVWLPRPQYKCTLLYLTKHFTELTFPFVEISTNFLQIRLVRIRLTIDKLIYNIFSTSLMDQEHPDKIKTEIEILILNSTKKKSSKA